MITNLSHFHFRKSAHNVFKTPVHDYTSPIDLRIRDTIEAQLSPEQLPQPATKMPHKFAVAKRCDPLWKTMYHHHF